MAAIMTYAAVLHLAAQCSGLAGATPREFVAGYVMEESGGDPNAWNAKNLNGSIDCGLGQINNSNWRQLGLDEHSCKDPCRNMYALAELMRWRSKLATGDPERGFYIAHPAGGSYVTHMTRVSDSYRKRSRATPNLAHPRRQQFVVLSSK